eukprot:MONOS_572.1-p1 / transcript=MONOS_572.1 / gene=MONOS_572 / organism=Monocercomonoides_exilis_PA203 / gene_product=unspecified product / transcript_product=unspecified product / location=Mono_scaffold00009:96073-96537(+) / protein_length=155 / sequence_SO=supercontig / SO=protein_coding / is_pseudo=false
MPSTPAADSTGTSPLTPSGASISSVMSMNIMNAMNPIPSASSASTMPSMSSMPSMSALTAMPPPGLNADDTQQNTNTESDNEPASCGSQPEDASTSQQSGAGPQNQEMLKLALLPLRRSNSDTKENKEKRKINENCEEKNEIEEKVSALMHSDF